MTTEATSKSFVFTGRHMLAILVAFFGVVITVNLLMAYLANSTWSGLVVQNSYVASQEFNGKQAEAKAWLATGIKGTLVISGSSIDYTLGHPTKGPMIADAVNVEFRRPVGTLQDFTVKLTPAGDGRFVGAREIARGEWIVDLTTLAAGKTIFHEAKRIHVGNGAL